MCNHAHRNIHQKTRFTLGTIKKSLGAALLPILALFAAFTFTAAPAWAESVIATVATESNPGPIAYNSSTNKIYVANRSSNSVTVIDGATNTTTTVAVGVNPQGIAVNEITNKIYVANFGSEFGDPPPGTVTVIDGATNTTSTVSVGIRPGNIAVNPIANKVYVSNYASFNVTVIDGATNTTSTVAEGTTPRAMAFNPTNNKVYVLDWASANVIVIDGTNNSINSVPVVATPEAITVNPNTNQIFVASNQSTVTAIDGVNNITNTAVLGTPAGSPAIAVNIATNQLYVSNQSNNSVSENYGGITNTIPAGNSPIGIVVNQATNKIYVANQGSNNVTVIDGVTKNTDVIATGTGPISIVTNPATSKTYVVNYLSNTVSVIGSATCQSITVTPADPTISVGSTQQFTATCTFSDGSSRVLSNGAWTTEASLPSARMSGAGAVVNGILYVVGGNNQGPGLTTVDAYDPATNTWVAKAPMSMGRQNPAVGVINGILYAVGGYGDSGFLASVEAYDPATNTWTTKAPMLTAHYAPVAGVINGILYVAGGQNNGFIATVEAYDPATNTWTSKASMPTARSHFAAGVVNNVLYAMGGLSSGGSIAVNEAYDPVTDTWTTKTPMLNALGYHNAGVVDGVIYVVNDTSYLSTVNAYDSGTDTWAIKDAIPTMRHSSAVGVINGIIHVAGGYNGLPISTVEAYTPPEATWSSGNVNVATIAANGLASGLSSGTSTITATVGNISGSTTLTVIPATYTLTLTPAGSGSGTVNGGGTYNNGSTVTVSATPAIGSLFTGWTGANAAECGTGSVIMNADKSCTANFVPATYTLTLTTAGSGSGTVSGSGTYNKGSTATVSATPAIGSLFTGWTGTNAAECGAGSVTMNADKSCTANFTPGATGYLSPSANAAVTTSAGDNNGYEGTPTKAYAADGLYATDTNSGSGIGTSCAGIDKDKHRYSSYNFAIPSGTLINGIAVQMKALANTTSGTPKICVQLSWDGGTTWTAAKSSANLTTANATYTLGSSSDTWGRTWATGDFGNTQFMVRVINVASSTSVKFSLDWIGVQAYLGSPVAPAINSTAVTKGTVGVAYSYQATATGTAPISWSLISGPAGMTIGSTTGLVQGWTPAAAGSYPVTIRATNAAGYKDQIYTITVADTGLKSPTANTAQTGGDGNGYLTNPSNAYVADGLFAVDTNSGSNTATTCTDLGKDRHIFYNYGYAIPAGATIRGLEVQLMAKVDSTTGSPKICAQISWDGGTTWTTGTAGILSTPTLTTTNKAYTLGGESNSWGRTWSGANDFTNANFRLRLINVSGATSSTTDFSLDYVGVRVYH
jgi:YVTN family beta-propeller protein